MLNKYISREKYESYEDFNDNFKINVPKDFNFGFDIVDEWAETEPNKIALVWLNDHGDKRNFRFTDIKEESNKICNYFKSIGIKKGDAVMLILKRRYEYWLTAVALHKIGAILIPGSFLLTEKDLTYRFTAANVKMIISVADDELINNIENALTHSPSVQFKAILAGQKPGWIDFDKEYSKESSEFPRPQGDEKVKANDKMLIYFTSGTTGMPKMVQHIQSYPLGHILTAKYWQQVENNGLHLTVSDSGWAKFGWGKIPNNPQFSLNIIK